MRACWLKWVGRDWSISADYIWLNYSGANSTMREGSVMSWKPRKCVIAGLVTTGPGGGLFATAMTSYRLFTYMF